MHDEHTSHVHFTERREIKFRTPRCATMLSADMEMTRPVQCLKRITLPLRTKSLQYVL